MPDSGVFTISLDTELAWGTFDRHRSTQYWDAYKRTPQVVDRLCDLFDRHGIQATWAFVAHIFDQCSGHVGDVPPAMKTWLDSAPCNTGMDRDLWYAPELLQRVQSCRTDQEVGLHGYSHLVWGKNRRETVEAELRAALDTANKVGIEPTSFVFPRNDIAHLDLLKSHGFEVFRGIDARWYERSSVPGIATGIGRFVDELAQLTPPTVLPVEREGLVRLPGCQIFRPQRGPWTWTPTDSQVDRARRGLDAAAETGRVFHLWFHPFDLAYQPDRMFARLQQILRYADELRTRGKIEICSLDSVGEMTAPGERYGSGLGSANISDGQEISGGGPDDDRGS